MKIIENIYIIYRYIFFIYPVLNRVCINLINKSPFLVLLLLFSLYVKNPLLYYIYTINPSYWIGIIICITLNFFILHLFKKIFIFFKLNERIFSFFFIVYDFFTHPVVLDHCLYSIIFIPWSDWDIMLTQGRSVKLMADRAANKALMEWFKTQNQIRTSNAICEAIPNRNNVWYQIFYEHRRRCLSDLNFWRFKYQEATIVSNRIMNEVMMHSGQGRGVTIYVDFLI